MSEQVFMFKKMLVNSRLCRLTTIAVGVLFVLTTVVCAQEDEISVEGVGIEYGPETTVLSGPLRADGSVDYVAALNERYGAGLAAEDNGFVDLARVMGEKYWLSAGQRARVFEMLGVEDDGDVEGETYVDLVEFFGEAYEEDEVRDAFYDKVMGGPWKAADYPEAAAWIEANGVVFEAVDRVCERRGYWVPLVPEDDHHEQVIMHTVPTHEFSRHVRMLMVARAYLRMGQGKIDGAMDDALLIIKLSRTLGESPPTGLENLAARVTGHLGNGVVERLCAEPKLTGERARSLYARLASMPKFKSVVPSIDLGERYFWLGGIIRMGLGQTTLSEWIDGERTLEPEHRKAIIVEIDINQALRDLNRVTDRYVAYSRLTDFAKVEEGFKTLEDELSRRCRRAINIGKNSEEAVARRMERERWSQYARSEYISSICIELGPSITPSMVRTAWQSNQAAALNLVGVAVTAFEREHGRYPESLGELVPGYLPTEPMDLFNKKPLRYRHNGKGFIVYSVGPNLKDDGGRTARFEESGGAPDVVMRVGDFPEPDVEE